MLVNGDKPPGLPTNEITGEFDAEEYTNRPLCPIPFGRIPCGIILHC